MEKTSKPFAVFAKKMKTHCEKGIETCNLKKDRRMKALWKAIESGISAVETGEFPFKFDQGRAGTAYFKDNACQERAVLLEEARAIRNEFIVSIKNKDKEEEVLFLNFLETFFTKFEQKKMYTYESALNRIANVRNQNNVVVATV